MNKKNELIGMVELCGAFFLGGSCIVVGKYLTAKIPLFLLSCIVIFIALTLLGPFLIKNRSELKRLKLLSFLLVIMQAITGVVLTRTLTLWGLRYTSGLEAGIINSSTPAVMAFFAITILREKCSLFQYLGILFAVAGMTVVNWDGILRFDVISSLKGNLIIFGSVVCEVLMTVLRKKSKEELSPITNAALLFLISLLIFFPFAVKDLLLFNYSTLSGKDWLLILYYGYMGSGVAYILWSSGAKKATGVMAGTSIAMIPLTAIILSIIFLGDRITTYHIVGVILSFSGMVLSTLRTRKEVVVLPKFHHISEN